MAFLRGEPADNGTTYVHLVPYAVDHGYQRASSVGLIGAVGIASIVGRFLLGGLADRIGSRRTISPMSADSTPRGAPAP